jgi:hypothetical protein
VVQSILPLLSLALRVKNQCEWLGFINICFRYCQVTCLLFVTFDNKVVEIKNCGSLWSSNFVVFISIRWLTHSERPWTLFNDIIKYKTLRLHQQNFVFIPVSLPNSDFRLQNNIIFLSPSRWWCSWSFVLVRGYRSV